LGGSHSTSKDASRAISDGADYVERSAKSNSFQVAGDSAVSADNAENADGAENADNTDIADSADSANSAESVENAENADYAESAEGMKELSPGWRLWGTPGISSKKRLASKERKNVSERRVMGLRLFRSYRAACLLILNSPRIRKASTPGAEFFHAHGVPRVFAVLSKTTVSSLIPKTFQRPRRDSLLTPSALSIIEYTSRSFPPPRREFLRRWSDALAAVSSSDGYSLLR
jgi:hypothetical protein